MIPVTDTHLFFSPYTWRIASGEAVSNAASSYLRLAFSGSTACVVNLSVAHMVSAGLDSSLYPEIEWQVDGGVKTRVTLNSASTGINLGTLSTGAHEVFVQVVSLYYTPDRYNDPPLQSVRLTGVTLDGGATLLSPTIRPNRMIVFGDSHGEGYEALASPQQVSTADSGKTYGVLLADRYNCEYGIVAYGAQGYNQAVGASNLPSLEDAWDFYWSGKSRLVSGLLSPAPQYIVSAHGSNDTANSALTDSVESCIDQWRAAAPHSLIVICMIPNQAKIAEITAGVTAAADPRTYAIDPAENLIAIAEYHNSTHLSVAGHARYAELIEDLLEPIAPDNYVLTQTANSSPVTELWKRAVVTDGIAGTLTEEIIQHSGPYPTQPDTGYAYAKHGATHKHVFVFDGSLTLEQAIEARP